MIKNEISSIGACFNYLFDEGHHSIRKLKFPKPTKNISENDGELVTRQTFTRDEYRLFTTALSKTYVAPVSVKNNITEKEWFDRQLVRHYFLFAANSGMRSGELRILKWEDVEIEVIGRGNTPEQKLAKVKIPALNTKIRKFRKFYCVGAVLRAMGKTVCQTQKRLHF